METAGKPSVYIAMPTAEGNVRIECMQSVVNTVNDLNARGLASYFTPWQAADLITARNFLVSYFLSETNRTHLLFVDRDMHFPAGLCWRMLSLDAPVVGCIYPRRSFDYKRFFDCARKYDTAEAALAASQDYNFRVRSGILSWRDGVAEVDGVGMGVTLISREVLETLVARGAVRKAAELRADFPRLSRGLYGFFDPVTTASGDVLSEDYSFCERVRACGGRVLAVVDTDIGHIGDMRFGAPFLTKLGLGQS